MSAPANQLNREQSRALLAASFSPRLRETEAAIVAHAEGQAKARKAKLAASGVPTESQSQKALVRWWAMACRGHKIPEIMLFAVPNGGARDVITGARMKQEGQRAGVADLLLPVARGGYHGLAIEMKRKFGDSLRSKTQTAQFNEVLCKCLCFNLSMLVHSIHELGIEPKFWLPQEVAS